MYTILISCRQHLTVQHSKCRLQQSSKLIIIHPINNLILCRNLYTFSGLNTKYKSNWVNYFLIKAVQLYTRYIYTRVYKN